MKRHGVDVFVSPHPDGGWQVKKSGATKAYRRFDRKSDAVACGRQMAKREASELVVQTQRGRIHIKDSHGRDPRRTKG